MSRTSIEIVAPSPAASGSLGGLSAFELHENLQAQGLHLSRERVQSPFNNDDPQPPSRTKSTLFILVVTSMIFIGSLLTGILTVALPRIARDIQLQENLLLWWVHIYI